MRAGQNGIMERTHVIPHIPPHITEQMGRKRGLHSILVFDRGRPSLGESLSFGTTETPLFPLPFQAKKMSRSWQVT